MMILTGHNFVEVTTAKQNCDLIEKKMFRIKITKIIFMKFESWTRWSIMKWVACIILPSTLMCWGMFCSVRLFFVAYFSFIVVSSEHILFDSWEKITSCWNNSWFMDHGNPDYMISLHVFNSLGPSDAMWWQRSGSTLAQVMACCLTPPSHYLNQCWLIISKVEWHSSKGKFTRDTSAINHWNYL